MNEEIMKKALDIVKAQASVRPMNEEEILTMVQSLSAGLEGMVGENLESTDCYSAGHSTNGRKSIRERSITCLECGRSFKILTKKHLASHNLDASTYLAKYGLKKGTQLVCKSLQRERRKKMQEMKLWERRRSGGQAKEEK